MTRSRRRTSLPGSGGWKARRRSKRASASRSTPRRPSTPTSRPPIRWINRALGRYYSVERAAGRSMAFQKVRLGGRRRLSRASLRRRGRPLQRSDVRARRPGRARARRRRRLEAAQNLAHDRPRLQPVRAGRHSRATGLAPAHPRRGAPDDDHPDPRAAARDAALGDSPPDSRGVDPPRQRRPLRAGAALCPALSLLWVADSPDRPDEGLGQRGGSHAGRLGHAAATLAAVAVPPAPVGSHRFVSMRTGQSPREPRARRAHGVPHGGARGRRVGGDRPACAPAFPGRRAGAAALDPDPSSRC